VNKATSLKYPTNNDVLALFARRDETGKSSRNARAASTRTRAFKAAVVPLACIHSFV
jgi:hypothetical protein